MQIQQLQRGKGSTRVGAYAMQDVSRVIEASLKKSFIGCGPLRPSDP